MMSPHLTSEVVLSWSDWDFQFWVPQVMELWQVELTGFTSGFPHFTELRITIMGSVMVMTHWVAGHFGFGFIEIPGIFQISTTLVLFIFVGYMADLSTDLVTITKMLGSPYTLSGRSDFAKSHWSHSTIALWLNWVDPIWMG